jgi:energy-coupling factor transporter ATP-binding protein EcfA2
MKIASVRIENFRGFKDETIDLENYTCFVGPNGSGKSTVLAALNVFFRQYKDSKTDLSKLSVDDFHHKDVKGPIKITVTFIGLTEQAKKDLSDYVRQDKLIVSSVATYDPILQVAEVKQFGNRLGMLQFKGYFEADKEGGSAKELVARYEILRTEFPDLPVSKTKAAMADALRAYESVNPDKLTLLPSEDQFYGATKGANRLAPHMQWIFVPASKDLAEEGEEKKNSALGQLLARTIRAKVNFAEKISALKIAIGDNYQKILDAEQSVLDELSVSIELKLRSWAHPNATARILWRQDPEKSVKVEEPWAFIRVGERGFESELVRFGHGMQRSCMLTLLQEIASADVAGSVPTLIMGIEEPELYQHPPQARYLSEVLHELAEKNAQIVVCSHSALFIPGDNFEAVRVVREKGMPAASCVTGLTYKSLADRLNECGQKLLKESGMLAKLYSTLHPVLNEMFFCKVLVLVEGIEDVSYLSTYLQLGGKIGEFRRYGCHIVPVGRKSDILKPLVVAKLLGIPVYTIFDADADETDATKQAMHKRDNKAILKALGHDGESDWPDKDIWKADCTIWSKQIGPTVKGEVGAHWSTHFQAACATFSNPGELHKNPLAVSKTLELAWNAGHRSESLSRLAEGVITFAKGKAAGETAAGETAG